MTLFNRDFDLLADEVSSWVQSERMSTSFALIAMTAIIYDIAITIDKEIHYFWSGNFSLVKLVFFLNRYTGIIGAVMELMGSSALWINEISKLIAIMSIDYVLTKRVLALFSNEKKLSIVLYSLLILEAIGKSVLVVVATRLGPVVNVRISPHLTTCGYDEAPLSFPTADWSIFLVYGSLLLGLAMFKGWQFWKLNGYTGSRLVMVLIRDQALYYLLAIFSSMMNILGFKLDRSAPASDILFALGQPTFLCILGSRMFFNLKEAAEHGVNVGTNWSSYSHSAIDFNKPTNSHLSTGSEGLEEGNLENGG